MVTVRQVVVIVMIELTMSGSFGCGRKPEAQPVAEKPKASRFVGYLDGASEQHISGWAMDEKNVDDSVMVTIIDGDALLGAIKADIFRKDLREKNIGNGKYGFAFPIPASLFDGKAHRIHAKIQGTDVELKFSPKELTFGKPKGS